MCKTIIAGLMLFSCIASAQVRVAVIDTGYNGKDHLCATGHYDFINHKAEVGVDERQHGTVVAHAIEKYASGNYCLVVLKVFTRNTVSLFDIINAIHLATAQKVDVINLSISGGTFNAEEYNAIATATRSGIKVFIASGNDSKNLDKNCDVFPACYHIKGVTVVGSLGSDTKANYGYVVTQKESYCFEGICGTSMSTGIAAGKYIKELK